MRIRIQPLRYLTHPLRPRTTTIALSQGYPPSHVCGNLRGRPVEGVSAYPQSLRAPLGSFPGGLPGGWEGWVHRGGGWGVRIYGAPRAPLRPFQTPCDTDAQTILLTRTIHSSDSRLTDQGRLEIRKITALLTILLASFAGGTLLAAGPAKPPDVPFCDGSSEGFCNPSDPEYLKPIPPDLPLADRLRAQLRKEREAHREQIRACRDR